MRMRIRPATSDDVPALEMMIAESVRTLQADDYTQEQREAALQQVFGVDSQLIADRTYFVVEALEVTEGGKPRIAGCGGWSKRRTLYGGDQFAQREDTPLDPAHDAAKIRAFFVHPAWARRGIGSKILATCESAARRAGFTRFEMGATLTGVKLFAAKGYKPVKRIQISLGEGESLAVIQMEKRDSPQ